jgi:hypothetical protein
MVSHRRGARDLATAQEVLELWVRDSEYKSPARIFDYEIFRKLTAGRHRTYPHGHSRTADLGGLCLVDDYRLRHADEVALRASAVQIWPM